MGTTGRGVEWTADGLGAHAFERLAEEGPGVGWLAARFAFLQQISTALAAATTVAEVSDIVFAVLAEPTECTQGLWLCRPELDDLVLVAQRNVPADAIERFARVPVGAAVPVAVAHRERRSIRSESRASAEAEFAGLEGVPRLTTGFLAVPLLVGDRSLGVFGLGIDVVPGEAEVLFLEAVAGQVAQSVERLDLTGRDRRRRAEFEFLAELTKAALSAADHAELMGNVTAAAVPMLGDWCSIHFVSEDGAERRVSIGHVDPTRAAWAQEIQERHPFDPDAPAGVAAVLRSGITEHIARVDQAVIDAAIERSTMSVTEARAVIEALQPTSVITVPLRTKRRVVGAMQFVSAESGRIYDEHDVALAEAVAGRLAEPLDSAWLTDQQREIAVALQRALLPPRLPVIPGVNLTARYLPAGISEVGGDFYDVFAIDDHTWAILIGDVCGTGPNAAAVSSIARHTVRAAARHGLDPCAVVDWLNEAILLSDRELFCTACYATVTREEGGGWTLRTVAAGHPLPIVTQADVTRTVGAPGTLLGVFPSVTTHPTETRLGPDDLLVLYTDGVTDLPPPNGLDEAEMTALVAALVADRSASAVASGIERSIDARLPDRRRHDDVALVVAHIEPTA